MPEPTVKSHAAELARLQAAAGPTDSQKIVGLENTVGTLAQGVTRLAHKVEGMVSRKDSVRREDDDDARDARLAKLVADAVSAALRQHHDDRRRDRHEDDDADVPPEQVEEEQERRAEPQPMASDDDRLGREDRHHREDDRRDDSRADSQVRKLRRELDDLRRAVRRPVQDAQYLNELSEVQQEWDRVAQMHGQRASRPLDGERIESYDRRLGKTFQKYSGKWSDTNLADLPVDVLRKVTCPEIRADAIAAAWKSDPSPGALQREVITTDRTGRKISTFVGPVSAPNGMFAPFALPPLRLRGFNRNPNRFD